MTTLKHIEASMAGNSTVTPNGIVPDFVSDNTSLPGEPEAKEPKQEFVLFKLKNINKRGGVYLPHIDDVKNPKKDNKIERIRLLSGVDTIWLSEQKHVTEDYARQNIRNIEFPRGVKVIQVSKDDATMLEFMRICNSNIGNPNRIRGGKFEFFEFDPAAAEKEALEREMLEVEMSIEASKLEGPQIRKIASFIRISLHNEVGEMKTDDGLKRDVILYAKRNPVVFKKLITTQTSEVDISFAIRKAIANMLIDVSTFPGKAVWSAGGTIGMVPKGSDAVRVLTELALTNTEEGRSFKEHLKTLM